MKDKQVFTLINEQTGNLAFKILPFIDNTHFDYFQRNNYYTLIWILNGSGNLRTGFSEFSFEQNSMFSFAPYQPFMIQAAHCEGIAIFFHSDFFCIHKHQTEVTCNGVLFNNIYQLPIFYIDELTKANFQDIVEKMKIEINNAGIAQYEMLISYMKILLITASRIKSEQLIVKAEEDINEPEILQKLKNVIEENYRSKHMPAEYALMLNISQKALAKLIKQYYQKTFTELITERILIEAKRELYLTNKTVKEIAYELGYDDEHYFSRFFKKNAEISAQQYRETVGFGKAEIDSKNET
ncbi:helix-turn-helix domain-containing protein [Galbibacter sp. EGI 63066]|uniref:helix-turn-helix domain-containing protein n=1 Tax=Galbibacter sp. EGI 63066 TaxID=2993559 RepID=UPI00224912B7|nr:helix-turn-helix domain-containing protein [Galbibacter sp. EGI 63066]MCX2679014.1 helix-turn-helix domain-containing protein [Galbibacter sp. EGI 63066]